jgi:subtilisin family serine protease
MEIRPASAPGSPPPRPPASPAFTPPKDTWTASQEEPIRLIIQHPDPERLEALKQTILERSPGSRVTAELPLIGGFAVSIDPEAIEVLPELTKVARNVQVHRDRTISIPPDESESGPSASLDTAVPTLEVQRLHQRGLTGKGVNIAIIDTGLARHPDLRDKIVAWKDLVNGRSEPYDDQGHGTHVGSIAAGTGQASQGRFKGVAPEAGLVGVKVLDSRGSGSFSNVIAGIQWAVENKDRYNIKVINLSLGARARESWKTDPVAQAVEAAQRAGIVVCVAAGNSGPREGTVGTPAHAPHVITVANLDDRGTLERSDDAIARSSSRGPTGPDRLAKPDLAAPGTNITAADSQGEGYRTLTGTSMATPFVAGVAALMWQARPQADPEQIKEILLKSADRLTPPAAGLGTPPSGYTMNDQGAGVVDPVEAVEFLLSLGPGEG